MCHDELFHVLLIAGKKKTCLRWLCFLSIPAEQHLPNEVICFMCHCQKFWQCPPVSPRPGVNLITITITGLLISWGRCLWSEYGWHLLDEKKTHTVWKIVWLCCHLAERWFIHHPPGLRCSRTDWGWSCVTCLSCCWRLCSLGCKVIFRFFRRTVEPLGSSRRSKGQPLLSRVLAVSQRSHTCWPTLRKFLTQV